MAITNTKINTGSTAVYTSAGDNAIVVAYFCNTSTAPAMFSVHAVPAGGAATADNLIYANVNLTANDTYVMDTEKLILGDGDAIWATSTEDDVVVVTIFNVEV